MIPAISAGDAEMSISADTSISAMVLEARTPEARAAGTHAEATDDAALCEALGVPVFVVQGSERALKVTAEADFARADALAPLPE